MEDVFTRGWQDFVARTNGPMNLRFVMQPLVACLLAIRAGLRDARADRPAFLRSLVVESHSRWSLLREAFSDASRVLIMAAALDIVYQLLVLRGVYLLELLFTIAILALLPYFLIRGPANRLARGVSRLRQRVGHG